MRVLLATRTDFLSSYLSHSKEIYIVNEVDNYSDLLLSIKTTHIDVIVVNECLMYRNNVDGLFLDQNLIIKLRNHAPKTKIILIGSTQIQIDKGGKDKIELLYELGVNKIFFNTYSKRDIIREVLT